jgi:hypothetical protein
MTAWVSIAHSILHLQRTIDNQAALRFLQTATEKIDGKSGDEKAGSNLNKMTFSWGAGKDRE